MKHLKFKLDVNHNDVMYFTPEMNLLFSYVVYYFINAIKKDCIITSLKSDRMWNDKGVHVYGRGADFRTHHLTESEKKQMLFDINSRFNYGKGKKCAIIHGGEAEHLHIQAPYENKNFVRF